jgi:hypothetical protein
MAVNARAILINKKALGTDALVDKILNEPESAEGLLFATAKRLKENPLKKQYIEASLLASRDLQEISDLLEIPLDVINMYHTVYYEVIDLDKLSKLELLNVNDKGEGLLKLWALSQGLEFVKWRLGGKVSVSPIEGLQDLFTTCIYKSKEAMFNGNTSEASKESTKYIKLAMDLARLLKIWVMDSAAARHDIELALKEVVPNFGGLDSLDDKPEDKPAKKKKVVKEDEDSDEEEDTEPLDDLEIDTAVSISDLLKENDGK